jgi:hypothetical protein
LACSQAGSAPTETPTAIPPTATITATATNTPRPTSTPRPSPTPDVAATQRADDFYSLLQKFNDKGYISTLDGDAAELDPFKEDWAQLGWYQWWPFDFETGDFVFSGHLKWSTASPTPEISGCGIVFGLQENGDHYVVFLDKSRILFLMSRGPNVYTVGKTRGPGTTNYSNPAEADFAVSVKGQSTYVSVDGTVTEYTLSQDQTSKGQFGFSVLSGTNKDYGTRCEMTNMIFWQPKE